MLLLSLAVILLIFPWLFPILMLLIKLDSKGPIFFCQKRVGFLGRTFRCYKFRTMQLNEYADTRRAAENDPRITRVGRFLRNTCMDEIPQFINVLLGQMSIVGPRPHMLKDSQEFSDLVDNYNFRLMARPGITGLSQVRGYRGPATSFESIFRRYQWDSFYVQRVSFILDLKIMMETGLLMIKIPFLRGDQPVPRDRSQSVYRQEKPREKTLERPWERTLERPLEKSREKTLERPWERTLERPLEKSREKTLERPHEKTLTTPGEGPQDRPLVKVQKIA